MPIMSNPPDPAPRRPRLVAPQGSCDSHIHVFGPASRYPFSPKAAYHSPDALPETYLALQAVLGLERAVIIHPTALGEDQSRTLDALAAYPGRFRAVAVPAPSTSDAELDRMHRLGVRGIRHAIVSHFPNAQGLAADLARRGADRGWHSQLLVDGDHLEDLAPKLMALPGDVVIDHMGRVPAELGIGHPGFQALLRLLDSGRVWVKLSGPMRFSASDRFPYADTLPFARALVACNPERLVWGSDWPHINYNSGVMPNDGDLVDMLLEWAPDESVRRRILVDNPARLYDFPMP
jgi:predicted TIM-barrel fold metal-dependent hydrolase